MNDLIEKINNELKKCNIDIGIIGINILERIFNDLKCENCKNNTLVKDGKYFYCYDFNKIMDKDDYCSYFIKKE